MPLTAVLQVRLKQESLNEARSAPRKRPAAGPGGGNGGSGSGGAAPQGLSGDQWYSQSAMRAVNQVGLVAKHTKGCRSMVWKRRMHSLQVRDEQLARSWCRSGLQPYGCAMVNMVQ